MTNKYDPTIGYPLSILPPLGDVRFKNATNEPVAVLPISTFEPVAKGAFGPKTRGVVEPVTAGREVTVPEVVHLGLPSVQSSD